MQIKVVKSGQGKFGPWVMIGKDANGQGIFLGVKDKSLTLDDFPQGATLDVETEKNKNGKENIVKLLNGKPVANVEVGSSPVPKVDVKETVASAPVAKPRDFDAESRGKTRCAVYCAALQSQALAQHLFNKECGIEDITKAVREIAEDGLKYTFEGR